MIHNRNPTEARQASSRKTNYRVLIASMVIAVVAAIALYVYFYSQAPQ